jgi:translation initiation factor IF-2
MPHELRAREFLEFSQKRQVHIRGAGPQSTRAGRPPPSDPKRVKAKDDRLTIAKIALEKAKEHEAQKQAAMQGVGPPPIRRPLVGKRVIGDNAPQALDTTTDKASEWNPQWTQLRRRGHNNVAPPLDPFTAGRAQRMEEAKLMKFTSLAPGSAFRPSDRRSSPMQSPACGAAFQSQHVDVISPEIKSTPSQRSSQRNSDIIDSSQLSSNKSTDITERSFYVKGNSSAAEPSEAVSSRPRFTISRGIHRDSVRNRTLNLRVNAANDRSALDSPPQSKVLGSQSPFTISQNSTHDGSQVQDAKRASSQFTLRRPISVDSDQSVEANMRSERSDTIRESREVKDKEVEPSFPEVRSKKSRKSPARFSDVNPSYDNMPRGKGRDKARRRQQFLGQDEDLDNEIEENRRRAELKKQRKIEKAAKKAAAPTPILLPEYISVSNLAMALKVRVETFIEKIEELGYEETGTDHILNSEDSGLIAMEYNYEAIIDRGESEDLKPREPAADPSLLSARPPVVTIMGHVDHGKTTLLDWLRKSSVAATEHGGITQHIGAFSVPMPSGKIITFLDTPGHAAFISMRQRGANVTDIVILVVAADDSVKPQTIEAIKHAKEAKVPIIVAINKIDKEEANVDRAKQDLARHGVDVEDYGGDTQVVCVSGKTGKGMEELEEAAVTLSEILDMRAETDGQAEGWVLEASIKSMGKVATVLVRRGTMRPGDFIVAGKTWARIRCLRNEAGVEIESAGPGTPVEIDGWREQPEAGDEVLQATDEGKAKSVVDYRLEKEERDKMADDMEAINESRKAEQERKEREKEAARLAAEAAAADQEYRSQTGDAKPTGPKQIFFIIKGDVSGSVEAVNESISALGDKEVQPHVLRYGVGQVSEFDIEHAAVAKGHVISFNTPIEPHIAQLAEKNKVTILDHKIIYRLVDDVRAELSRHLPPIITQRVLGEAEIAKIFEITVKGRQQKNIAGCKVRNGTVSQNAKVRVMRNDQKVFDGMIPFTPSLHVNH